ncbi:MAG: hypothetical protein E6Q84_01110 [Thiothrix sp.]|nr:MAG: hypothetical protein E6Q84_01110 [Thiothrix sp.]
MSLENKIENLTHKTTFPDGSTQTTEKVFTKLLGEKIGGKLDEWTDNVTTHDNRQTGECSISVGNLEYKFKRKKEK